MWSAACEESRRYDGVFFLSTPRSTSKRAPGFAPDQAGASNARRRVRGVLEHRRRPPSRPIAAAYLGIVNGGFGRSSSRVLPLPLDRNSLAQRALGWSTMMNGLLRKTRKWVATDVYYFRRRPRAIRKELTMIRDATGAPFKSVPRAFQDYDWVLVAFFV